YDFEALHWKDVQARLAQTPEAGPGYYHLPTDLPDDWFKQFLSEHKVVDRKRGKRGRSGRPIRIWKTRTTASANHWWDAAILCCLATDPQVLNLRALPDPSVPPPSPPRRRRPPNTRPEIRTKY
ncbi:MAG TPA: terminase gpA endonuclease subunit, partial [Phycisphaerae bacterium]|nr:terminase gpA endonuclease subunit [Phycisphaerae bacterium]